MYSKVITARFQIRKTGPLFQTVKYDKVFVMDGIQCIAKNCVLHGSTNIDDRFQDHAGAEFEIGVLTAVFTKATCLENTDVTRAPPCPAIG